MRMRIVNGHMNYIYIASQIKIRPVGDFSEYLFLILVYLKYFIIMKNFRKMSRVDPKKKKVLAPILGKVPYFSKQEVFKISTIVNLL